MAGARGGSIRWEVRHNGCSTKTLMIFRVLFFFFSPFHSLSVSRDHGHDLDIDFTCNCLTLKYLAPILNYCKYCQVSLTSIHSIMPLDNIKEVIKQ